MAKVELWDLETREDNGSGNNLAHDAWGQAGTPLLRDPGTALYSGDDPNTPAPNDGPRAYPVHATDANGNPIPLKIEGVTGPLDFINEAVRTTTSIPNSGGTNELSAFYGQFITHDMTASAIPVPGITPAELFPNAPAGSPLDGINRTPGTVVNGVLEQTNGVTHYIDLSDVYGSGQVLPTTTGAPTTVNDALRVVSSDAVQHAKLLTGAGGGLPTFQELLNQHPEAVAAAWGPTLGAFPGPTQATTLVTGDARAAQTPFLAAIQTVWTKEHNYQVDQLATKYSAQIASGEISSDDLYNMARVISEAENQHIVYDEYLAAIIGKANAPQFTGYDPTVNGGVENIFTTVAFRFGHDQQSNSVPLVNADGTSTPLDLLQSFLSTTAQLQAAGGLEQVLRGLEIQKSQQIDGKISNDLIDNVLGIPGLNLNLGLLDNVRASDHGIGTLNQIRGQLGLDTYDSWSEFGSKNAVAADVLAKLQEYYGDVSNIDPWIGGLLEKHVAGSQLGETFQTIVIDQFQATMSGDRFFYEERLKDFPELLADVKGVTFADITMRDTGVDHIHADSFHVAKTIAGTDKANVLNGSDDASFLKADNIIGGKGDDKIYGKLGSDTLWGDDGRDYLDGGDGDDHIYGGTGDDAIYGGKGDDIAHGGDGKDYIDLGAGDDWANGETGNDTILGGDGNDIVLGKEGNDCLDGGKGNDQLFGGDGNDTVSGGIGDDLCYGGKGNDCISAGAGNDKICGEAGNDTMSGGAGNDIFIFAKGSGKDTITDFEFAKDKIDVSGFGYDDMSDLHLTFKGSTMTIDFGDGDSVSLIGVKKAVVSASMFVFDHHDNALVA